MFHVLHNCWDDPSDPLFLIGAAQLINTKNGFFCFIRKSRAAVWISAKKTAID